mgnify:CR=1 FL=1
MMAKLTQEKEMEIARVMQEKDNVIKEHQFSIQSLLDEAEAGEQFRLEQHRMI